MSFEDPKEKWYYMRCEKYKDHYDIVSNNDYLFIPYLL